MLPLPRSATIRPRHDGGWASGGADEDAEHGVAGGLHAERRRRVAQAIAARDHAAFSTMIYAGLRIEEATALTVDDLSFARGAEEVRVAKGKGKKGSRITEGTLRRGLYGWVKESRIKKADVRPHDLRHTFGTWYLQENPGQLIELAELMGHSNLSQVRKYALSDAERARAGVAKL